jgi:hypothetical protein
MELVLQLPMEVMHCCCTIQEWTFILMHGVSAIAGVHASDLIVAGDTKVSKKQLSCNQERHRQNCKEDTPLLGDSPGIINAADVDGDDRNDPSSKEASKLSRRHQISCHNRICQGGKKGFMAAASSATYWRDYVQDADPEFMQLFTTFFSNLVRSSVGRSNSSKASLPAENGIHAAGRSCSSSSHDYPSGLPFLHPMQLLGYMDLDVNIIHKALTKLTVYRASNK